MNKIAYFLLILAMIAWGETWVSAKMLGNYMSADELIFWRFFFTSVGMIIVLILFKIDVNSFLKRTMFTILLHLLLHFLLKLYLTTKLKIEKFKTYLKKSLV